MCEKSVDKGSIRVKRDHDSIQTNNLTKSGVANPYFHNFNDYPRPSGALAVSENSADKGSIRVRLIIIRMHKR